MALEAPLVDQRGFLVASFEERCAFSTPLASFDPSNLRLRLHPTPQDALNSNDERLAERRKPIETDSLHRNSRIDCLLIVVGCSLEGLSNRQRHPLEPPLFVGQREYFHR
jgi:hypothetical protein